MRVLALAVLAGCSQLFGLDDPQLGDAGAAVDVPSRGDAEVGDGPAPSCVDRWLTGAPTFGTPTALTALNTAAVETDPYLTFDGLTLYFVRSNDIYRATRATTSQPFSSPVIDPMLSSGAADGKVYVAMDGTQAFFASARTGSQGGIDVFRASRGAPGDAWSIDQLYLATVNDALSQHDPHLSPDLLRIYYAPLGTSQPGVVQAIAVASRSSASQAFGAPALLSELDAGSTGNEADPTLDESERVIVFSSTRSGVVDLYYATRASLSEPFGAPVPLTQLNTNDAADGGPHLSPDSCELYFESARDGTLDLYVARLN